VVRDVSMTIELSGLDGGLEDPGLEGKLKEGIVGLRKWESGEVRIDQDIEPGLLYLRWMAVKNFCLFNYNQRRVVSSCQCTHGHTMGYALEIEKYKRGQADMQEEPHLKPSCRLSRSLLCLKTGPHPSSLQVENGSRFCLYALAPQRAKSLSILSLNYPFKFMTSYLFPSQILCPWRNSRLPDHRDSVDVTIF
jgi:hypothetical protein